MQQYNEFNKDIIKIECYIYNSEKKKIIIIIKHLTLTDYHSILLIK